MGLRGNFHTASYYIRKLKFILVDLGVKIDKVLTDEAGMRMAAVWLSLEPGCTHLKF